MASFRPIKINQSIEEDESPKKKLRIDNRRISPLTVATETDISPSSLPLSVFSISTDDYDKYTYTPPLKNYQVTVEKNVLYPEIPQSIEYYLGPKEYWIDKISPFKKNKCNPFRSKQIHIENIKKILNSTYYIKIETSKEDTCIFIISVKINESNEIQLSHNSYTNETKLLNNQKLNDKESEILNIISSYFSDIYEEEKKKLEIINAYYHPEHTLLGSQIKQIIETDKLLANISDEDLKNSGGSKPSMNPLKFFLNKKERLPQRYAPKHLTKKDQKKQKKNLAKSRKLYKKGIYFKRPKVKSFKSKKSRHINNVEKIYGVKNMSIPELSKKTKCTPASLNKIIEKGQGAYYSSGSRPNQSAHSWGVARLASSLTGGNASVIDYHVLEEGCKPDSKALKLAKKQCKKMGRNCGNNKTKKNIK